MRHQERLLEAAQRNPHRTVHAHLARRIGNAATTAPHSTMNARLEAERLDLPRREHAQQLVPDSGFEVPA
jgi:hypothetical protein